MKLSKRLPARIETVNFLWCRKDFLEMSQNYRKSREGLGMKKMDTCFWCKHKFEDGEMMALACAEKRGNKLLCQTCADELLESEKATP